MGEEIRYTRALPICNPVQDRRLKEHHPVDVILPLLQKYAICCGCTSSGVEHAFSVMNQRGMFSARSMDMRLELIELKLRQDLSGPYRSMRAAMRCERRCVVNTARRCDAMQKSWRCAFSLRKSSAMRSHDAKTLAMRCRDAGHSGQDWPQWPESDLDKLLAKAQRIWTSISGPPRKSSKTLRFVSGLKKAPGDPKPHKQQLFCEDKMKSGNLHDLTNSDVQDEGENVYLNNSLL